MGPSESSRVGRGVAVLVVAMLGAGAFAISPATAGKFLTKKRALKLFYAKERCRCPVHQRWREGRRCQPPRRPGLHGFPRGGGAGYGCRPARRQGLDGLPTGL